VQLNKSSTIHTLKIGLDRYICKMLMQIHCVLKERLREHCVTAYLKVKLHIGSI